MRYKIVILFLIVLLSCGHQQSSGPFSIRYEKGYKEITDGIGRRFVLVSKNIKNISYEKSRVIKIPIKKAIVYSGYTAALIKELGYVDSIVGVVVKKKYWHIPEIKKGLEKGKIVYIGEYNAVDYEKLSTLKPDVVFSWDEGLIPKLEELGIPCVITSTKIAPNLSEHIRLILFLSAFYNEEEKAKRFINEQFRRIEEISSKLKDVTYKPKVIWGDIYPKKVLVEPGNSWAAEAVRRAGGRYLFDDVQGASCMQITVEKFFSRAKDADILITYRGPEEGITSKEAFKKASELLKTIEIKPMNEGRIYFTGWRLWETADTAGIIYELASIFHPKLFPLKKHNYFFEIK